MREWGYVVVAASLFMMVFAFIGISAPAQAFQEAQFRATVTTLFIASSIFLATGIIVLALSSILAQLETITTDADKEREVGSKKQKADSYGVTTGAEKYGFDPLSGEWRETDA